MLKPGDSHAVTRLRRPRRATARQLEIHAYNEGLLVISGQLRLSIGDEEIRMQAGQMYLVEAGIAHAALTGSQGTLVIIDV